MNELSEIERGVQAERILKDPLYLEAYDAVRLALLEKFEKSPVRDTEGREHLFKMLKALSDARGHLEQALKNGNYAQSLKKEKKRFQDLFR